MKCSFINSTFQKVTIVDFDEINFKIKAKGYGESFKLGKHPQVYSNDNWSLDTLILTLMKTGN